MSTRKEPTEKDIARQVGAVILGLRRASKQSKGITSQQVLMLLRLYIEDGGVAQFSLAAQMEVEKTAVGRNLDVFSAKRGGLGWLDREPDPDDGKSKIARLTVRGRSVLDKILAGATG